MKIAILCEMVYFYDMEVFQSGGGERYVVELYKLLASQGHQVDVLQFSHEKKTKTYGKMKIQGVGNITKGIGDDYEVMQENGVRAMIELTKNADLYIALTMNLCNNKLPKPTISISHGVYWDFDCPTYKQPTWNKKVTRWIENSDLLVSVDSNSVNWIRANCPRFIEKAYLIPNFADKSIYNPKLRGIPDSKKFVVLYPRRLHALRGYNLYLKMAEELTNKYDDIEFRICGKGLGDVEQQVKQWCEMHKNCVQASYSLETMYYAYKGIDLVVIPTLASEGTSLAAIESISCGIPIITTDVGGLNDICIDGVNGLKIRANDYENLLQAVEYAYLNREEVREWSEGALLISKAFDKKKWDASWIAIIDAFKEEIKK